MRSIYRGAAVTIAASSARRSTEGFLQLRSDWKATRLRTKLDPQNDIRVVVCHRPYLKRRNVPLDSRAWALQEILISPRILGFGDRNMSFACSAVEIFDGGIVSAYVDDPIASPGRPSSTSIRSRPTHPDA
jgi:hypothetical protein